MNDFCFVAVTYNQQEYIVQHLESVRYLVERYGKGMKIQFVMSDDCSRDDTVAVARMWLESHEGLFSEWTILEHEKNQGTIRNMNDAIHAVNAKSFNEMAGDDLYNSYDIFDVHKNADMVLSPTVHFFDDGKVRYEYEDNLVCFMHYQNKGYDLKRKIARMLSYNQCIESPGAFVTKEMWEDEGFQKFLMQFVFFEDIPEWYYFFNKYEKDFRIGIDPTPYILYRRSVGTSQFLKTKEKKSAVSAVDQDYRNVRKAVPATSMCLPKKINPYCYAHYVKTHMIVPKWKNEPNIKSYITNWTTEVEKAKQHLDLIMEEAAAYKAERGL